MLSGDISIFRMGLEYALRIECSLHKEHRWGKSMRMHSEASIKGNTSLYCGIREGAEFEILIFLSRKATKQDYSEIHTV